MIDFTAFLRGFCVFAGGDGTPPLHNTGFADFVGLGFHAQPFFLRGFYAFPVKDGTPPLHNIRFADFVGARIARPQAANGRPYVVVSFACVTQ